jgi:hypothetical protein
LATIAPTKFACFAALMLTLQAGGTRAAAQPGSQSEIEALRQQIAAQQEQINELRRLLDTHGRMLAKAFPAPEPVPAALPPHPGPASETVKAPTSINLGGIALTPTGFLEFSQVWRSRTVASGFPTNFAAIPFNNTVDGNRKQTLATAANTRLGMQLNTTAFGLHVLGVVETDFLGYQPGNISTTTNSYGLRLRLAFADLQAGKWEFLGGQNWSLLTPGRKGIAPVPAGLMLTQDLDPNNQSGLVWARSPQARVVYKPTDGIALGASFESGEPYAGGSGGAGAVALPAGLAPNYFNQVGVGSSGLAVPNPHLDFIGKIAFDPTKFGRNTHIEIAGLVNRFAFFNPLTGQRFATTGAGISLNASAEVVKNLAVFTNNFYSEGGGRFIYGEAPTLMIQGNGAPSLLHAMSTMQGLEYHARSKLRLWAYYGGTYINRAVAIDPSNGNPVGYGYTGSPNTQNRAIQEITSGFTRVFWQGRNYGGLQFSGQYSWVVRHPWYVAPGQPAAANLNMLYLGLRYVLPAAPFAGQ